MSRGDTVLLCSLESSYVYSVQFVNISVAFIDVPRINVPSAGTEGVPPITIVCSG